MEIVIIVAVVVAVLVALRNKDNITIGFGNTTEVNQVYDEVGYKDDFIECGTWIQDNYSQNARQGDFKDMLPKGTMRKDFTNEHYSMKEIVDEYFKRMR